jgi:hypothetical protein
MAYNAAAVSTGGFSMSENDWFLSCRIHRSRSLAAMPSKYAIPPMPSARCSVENSVPVCLHKHMQLLPAIKNHGAHDRKGLTFEQIAQAMNKDEVWVAALFYGQVS